jgi:hypothetical protein
MLIQTSTGTFGSFSEDEMENGIPIKEAGRLDLEDQVIVNNGRNAG